MYEKSDLSECEMVTMRCVWNLGKSATAFNIINMLADDYGLIYKETTVYTFLTKLKEKGYLDAVKKGVTYYIPRVSEGEYQRRMAKKYLQFWFHGNVTEAIREVLAGERVSKKEARSIREMLRQCGASAGGDSKNG